MSIKYALVLALALLIFSTGCTYKTPLPKDGDYSSHSVDVPFVAPRSELCGSTSIEMLSSYCQSKGSYTQRLSSKELDERTLTLNNLADLLCHTNRADEALMVLDAALTTDTNIMFIIEATRQEISKGCFLK